MQEFEWEELIDGESEINAEDINKLAEYAKELNINKPDASDVTILLTEKVDKEEGKGLSTNDFTTPLLNKLNGIQANATSSPKVISVTFEEDGNGEGWESWCNKTFFNQYKHGLYYINGGYLYSGGGEISESVLLLCTANEDGGEHINRLLITQNGDMYTNRTIPYNPDTYEYEEYYYDWQKISVSQIDLNKKVDKEEGKGLINYFKTDGGGYLNWNDLPTDYDDIPMGVSVLYSVDNDDTMHEYGLLFKSYSEYDQLTVIGPYGEIQECHYDYDLEKWTDWKDVYVSKSYIDNAIGDIEASLENIIKKYGLGGDDV